MKGIATFEFSDGVILTCPACEFTISTEMLPLSDRIYPKVGGIIKNPPLILSLLADHTDLLFSFSFVEKKGDMTAIIKIANCYFASVEETKVYLGTENPDDLIVTIERQG